MSIPSTRLSTSESRLAVVKVGGSLFDLPNLRVRLRKFIEESGDWRLCFVAGGGASADVVRGLQPTHQLPDAAAHRLAMESLRVGEQLLCELVPDSQLVRSATEVHQTFSLTRVCVVQTTSFVTGEACEPVLDETWDVTSDSIAAWIARVLAAQRLVLLKSTEPPDEVSTSRRVDEAFSIHAHGIPRLSWCNLRVGTKLTDLPASPN